VRLLWDRVFQPSPARRDVFEAMKQVAETGHGPMEQHPRWDVRSSGGPESLNLEGQGPDQELGTATNLPPLGLTWAHRCRLAAIQGPPGRDAQLRALVTESAHRVTGVASLILLADIGDQRLRALDLNFEGGNQRIFGVNDDVSRFPLKFKADCKLHLCSPAFNNSKDSTIQLGGVKYVGANDGAQLLGPAIFISTRKAAAIPTNRSVRRAGPFA
jgi:hypothetical protein